MAPELLERLRQRLRAGLQAIHGSDHSVAGVYPPLDQSLRPAAVLVPLVARASEPHIILTRRSEQLAHHPGQVSFPGGRSEPGDADAVATALREAEEEIGLPPSLVDILGILPDYRTVTGFLVTPVVGVLTGPFEPQADPFEVAEVFEVPLAFVLDASNHQRHRRRIGDQEREFFVLPYQDHFIWGATAAMLVNLALHIGPLEER